MNEIRKAIVSFSQRHSTASKWLLRASLVIGGLLIAIGLILSISNWNFARGALARLIEARIDRPVAIEGSLTASLLSWQPAIRVEDLKIGNPNWIDANELAKVEQIFIAINLRELFTGDLVLERLEIDHPAVTLVNDAQGRTNFDFSTDDIDVDDETDEDNDDQGSSRPPKLPVIRSFTLRGGKLYVRDEVHKLTFDGAVEASERSVRPELDPFHLRGAGTLNGEPFSLLFQGGPLANIKMDRPYEFDAEVKAGKTQGSASGAFLEPFDFARLLVNVDIKGENLAHLYYLTSLALPFTPPYHVAGEVQSFDRKVVVRKLNGKIGNSDLKGELTVDLTGKKPNLIARLRSQSLRLADLSPAFGKGVTKDTGTTNTADSKAPGDLPADKLLPTYRFEFDRLKTMNADVVLVADSIQTQKAPFEKVEINLKLDDGVIALKPIIFSLPQGNIAGDVRIDARDKLAKTELNLRVSNVKLDQFKGQKTAEPPLDGVLHARLQATGTGNSVHDFAATTEGKLNAVMPQGEIRKAFAELTGINVARGLGLLLAKDQTRTTVRCGVAMFDIKQGNVEAQQVIFDTDNVLVKVDGKVDLEDELFDLEIEGKPKKVQLVRLRSPVTLEGPLRKPALGVDASDTAKQVGIAGALGTLFAPLAAALAFIDPGLAKDADCAALLAQAEQATNQPAKK